MESAGLRHCVLSGRTLRAGHVPEYGKQVTAITISHFNDTSTSIINLVSFQNTDELQVVI